MSFVVPLSGSACGSVALVGGKAVNLARMTAAGLPVPHGFCVTTDAYRLSVGHVLDDLVPRLRCADVGHLPALAARCRAAVTAVEVPAVIRHEMLDAHERLGPDVIVAVRSSATAEDLVDASFAGQQDTYLGIRGAAALLGAVRDCWASLWTDRATAYRRDRGIDPGDVAIAVVVQRLVDARAAGVMFTANPVTGNRTQAVIEANEGLGETVVSGEVDPDRYVVARATGEIVERHDGSRGLAVRVDPAGGVVREQASSRGRRDVGEARAPVLDDAEVRDLTDLGNRVAAVYDTPQDTEWALDRDGTFWLTQARSVTTLFPLVGPCVSDGRRVYLCGSLAQGLTRPITPLGRSTIKLMTAGAARLLGVPIDDVRDGAPAIVVAGERLFADITTPLRHPLGRRLVFVAAGALEARTATALRQLVEEPDFAPLPMSIRPVLRTVGRLVVVSRLPMRLAAGLADPDRAAADITAFTREIGHLLDLPPDAPAKDRLAAVEHVLVRRAGPTMPTLMGYVLGGYLGLALARRLLGDRLRAGETHEVTRSAPNNPTTTMDLELWDLSVALSGDEDSREMVRTLSPIELTRRYREGSMPTALVSGLDRFLERWGMRAVAEIDLGMPRWSDDPTHIFGVLTNYLDVPAEAGARASFERGARAGEAKVCELSARMTDPIGQRVVAFALRRARRLVGLRECPKFALITLFGTARRELLLVGDALVAAGHLDAREDVVFCEVGDLRRGLEGEDLRSLVASNRASYQAELGRRHIPRLLLSDGTEVEAWAARERAPAADPDTLAGSPASPGVVTGPAKVVTDPVGARLAPGEILVAPSTDPGWTPLFLTAGGLVVEMGGATSHGAVVAREYGIPAVVGVPDATLRIASGDVVTVDGSVGTVRLQLSASFGLDTATS